MPGDGGLGKAGKLRIGNDGRLLEALGEPAQARAQHHRHRRGEAGAARADHRRGPVGGPVHVGGGAYDLISRFCGPKA